MTETIRGVSELVGADCLKARTEALDRFESLGPPDLCRLAKAAKPPWAGANAAAAGSAPGGEVQRLSFFHYVIGLDIFGAQAAVDYVQGLMQSQEKGPWMAWLFGGQHWDIVAGVYCCYDAFSRIDVRVEVPPAGSNRRPTACGVDADGGQVQLTRDMWEGAQLSAFLRALQPPPRVPGLRALPLFVRPGALDTFVRLATRLFAWGERLEGGPPELQIGAHPLCDLFCGYLVASRRLRLALEVLPSLQSSYPAVVVYIARAYVKRGQPEAALNVLVRAARDTPNDGAVLHCQAKVLLAERSPSAAEIAAAAAEHAVRLMPDVWRFWVTLAQAYLQLGLVGHALAALNAPPLSALIADEAAGQSPDIGLPDFSTAERTLPPGGIHGGLVALRPAAFGVLPMQKGMLQFGGFGPGFGLNPGLEDRRPLAPNDAGGGGGGAAAATTAADGATAGVASAAADAERELLKSLESCPGALLSRVECAAYEVLVGLHRQLGWDELLKQRSQVFLMVDVPEGEDAADEEEDDPEEGIVSSELGSSYQGSAVASEEVPGRPKRLPKRLCSKFLDRLFQALHSDLGFFNDWRREQEQLPRRPAHSSGALWMQRGSLATRLQQSGQAELAFRLCQARCACPRASLELLGIYAKCDHAVEAVAQLAVLCGIAAPDVGPNDARPWARCGGWPDWLFEAAAKLICRFDISAVHAAAGQLPDVCVQVRFALAELLRAAGDAGVEGTGR
mmetsp:Transcript_135112/g.431799  ORF Transcript_135112/g.431799 Transcript_135112/m.431799 type:complete len:733 (-) Transcript_135112:70-2268(-)